MSMSSDESVIQQKQHQHQNMTKVGHRKHHRQHVVKDVEAVVSIDEEENYDEDEDAKERPEDWDDNDGRWGSPPTVGKPTIVNCKILIAQLQDLEKELWKLIKGNVKAEKEDIRGGVNLTDWRRFLEEDDLTHVSNPIAAFQVDTRKV